MVNVPGHQADNWSLFVVVHERKLDAARWTAEEEAKAACFDCHVPAPMSAPRLFVPGTCMILPDGSFERRCMPEKRPQDAPCLSAENALRKALGRLDKDLVGANRGKAVLRYQVGLDLRQQDRRRRPAARLAGMNEMNESNGCVHK